MTSILLRKRTATRVIQFFRRNMHCPTVRVHSAPGDSLLQPGANHGTKAKEWAMASIDGEITSI